MAAQSLANEAEDIRKAAESKLGNSCEAATECMQTLKGAKQDLANSIGAFAADVTASKDAFKQAETVEGMQRILQELKNKKAERVKAQGTIRKAVSVLKAAMPAQPI